MKEGWEEKLIGDVCTIINGGTPKTNVPDYWDGNILWITPKDMGKLTSEYVSDTSRKISELGLQKSSAKIIPVNSIILSTRAPIGHLAINTKEITTNQGCRGIVPNENVDSRFLYYFCRNSVKLLNDLGSGTTFKELSKKALSYVKIPIPTLSEQKEIVSILDEAFAAIDTAQANIERNVANANELFQSRLNEIFSRKGEGWEEKRLGDVCSIINGGTPKTNVPDYWDGDMLWITPKDMGKLTSEYVSDTSRKISELGLQKSSAKIIPVNSIILSTRAPIGHLAINKKEMTTNQGCRGIVPNENVNSRFLYYFCSNSIKLFNDLGSGTTFKELSKKALSFVKITIPPLSEQKEIVAELDELIKYCNEFENNYKQKISNLEELKKSLLQKAFAGELT